MHRAAFSILVSLPFRGFSAVAKYPRICITAVANRTTIARKVTKTQNLA